MNKALLVIDVQEDIIGENHHKRFNYENREQLIANINKSIEEYEKKGYAIIYIAEVLSRTPIHKLIAGCLIKGTEGAKLSKDLKIVSDYYFEKVKGNALSNSKLCKLIDEKKIDKLVLCGFDESACVSATAKSAILEHFKVNIIKNSVGTINEKKSKKLRVHLKKAGVKYI